MSKTRDLTVVAMGGNSLIDEDIGSSVEDQFDTTARALRPVVDLIERGEQVVIVHGNGPQVGFMQLRSELSRDDIHEVPLDSLVADTQGSMGYMIQRALREELQKRQVDRPILAIVTEVEVDPEDRAFEEPTKPIGRFYKQEDVAQLETERAWKMVNDSNRGWRRVVASPSPKRIVQLDLIRTLVDKGWVVICCGGGGIPIVRDDSGDIRGMEAVIDKDRSSTLLAVALNAHRFVITTGVEAVYRDYLTEHPVRLDELDVEEVRTLAREGQFPPGSMRPKMEAGIYYCNRVPGEVIICRPEDLVNAIDRKAGTRIRKVKK